MKRTPFYPFSINDQVHWLENYRNKIVIHGAVLGLTPAQIAATVADARWLIYVLLTWLGASRAWSMACTDAVTEARTGASTGPMALPVFVPPALPDQVAPVAAGALTRILDLCENLRNHPACTEAIATDLGLVGSELTGPDLTTLQPPLKATRTGSVVNFPWTWGGNSKFLDALEIQVDRNDTKGWVLLVMDTTPGYVDSFPQPATPTVWKYRAIYRVDDAQVGQWSNIVSVAVGG